MDVRMGDVPTWIAMCGAIVAAWRANSIARIEEQRDKDSARRDRERQAVQVSAWVEGSTMQGSYGLEATCVVCVCNRSDQPVYAVDITVKDSVGTSQRHQLAVLPPRVTERFLISEQLRNNAILHVDIPRGQQRNASFAQDDARRLAQDLRVEVSFRDVSNNTWRRGLDGALVEAPETTAARPRRFWFTRAWGAGRTGS